MKNRITKIIVFALALALLIGSAVGIAVSAEDSGKVDIVAKNVIYGEKYQIAFAVDVPVENAADVTVEYKVGDKTYTASLLDTADEKNLYTAADTDVSYPVFATYGFAPNDLTDVVEVTAFLTANEPAEKTYEDYSVATYLFNMLFKHGLANATEEADVELRDMFVNLVNFSASAQKVIDNNPANNPDYVEDETLITDYGFIKVDASVGSVNGTDSVVAPMGTAVTLSEYLGDDDFACWALVDIMSGEQIKLVDAGEAIELDGIYEAVPHGFRGTGLYVDAALGYGDIEDVYNYDKIGFHCQGKNAISIVEIDGDAALKTIGQNDESDTIFKTAETLTAASGMVFETDIMFESVATTRANKEVITFSATNETSSHYNLSTVSISVTYVDNKITLTPTSTNSTSVTVEAGEWINIRYEAGYLGGQSKVELYINGTRVMSDTNKGGTWSGNGLYPTGIAMYNYGWNTTGTVTYLDNTYVGPLAADETYRATGKYADDAMTMDDITGAIGSATTTNGNITLFNKNGLGSAIVNGDAALQAVGSTSYQTDSKFTTSEVFASGDAFVAEFDIMFYDFNSTRALGEVLQVYGTNSTTAQSLLTNMVLNFTMVDGKLMLTPHSRYTDFEAIEIDTCKWYTIRYEIDNVQTGTHRIFVNGECVLEAEGGGVYSGNNVYISGINFYGLYNTQTTVFFVDNVYVGRP